MKKLTKNTLYNLLSPIFTRIIQILSFLSLGSIMSFVFYKFLLCIFGTIKCFCNGAPSALKIKEERPAKMVIGGIILPTFVLKGITHGTRILLQPPAFFIVLYAARAALKAARAAYNNEFLFCSQYLFLKILAISQQHLK